MQIKKDYPLDFLRKYALMIDERIWITDRGDGIVRRKNCDKKEQCGRLF